MDLAENAVARAQQESDGLAGVSFRALDATAPDAGEKIRADIGTDANVFVRGVFHILDPAGRAALARTLHPVVGTRGRVFLAETDFRGSQLGYLEHLGATATHIPAPLERAIADLPRPGHFGEPERVVAFPASAWSVVADGPTDIETIPLAGHPRTRAHSRLLRRHGGQAVAVGATRAGRTAARRPQSDR